jgi:hypothetical protein
MQDLNSVAVSIALAFPCLDLVGAMIGVHFVSIELIKGFSLFILKAVLSRR